MKNILRIIALAIVVMASNAAFAQEGGKPGAAKEQRLSREELAVAQAKHIASDLNFADDVADRFVETFCNCQKEIWALGPRPKGDKKKEMTEEETRAMLKDRFAKSEKILSVRKKYYEEYSKFLTQKQIEQVYEQEQKMMRRLEDRHQGEGRPKDPKGAGHGPKRGGDKK